MTMRFFERFADLRLDIVGFLAILGEGSVSVNAQNCSASRFCYLPRLLPAPQAFMRPQRLAKLPTTPGTTVSVWSGTVAHHVSYFADLLHDGRNLPRHTVRCMRVTRTTTDNAPSDPKSKGPLLYLSGLGALISLELIVLSILRRDGMALLATVLMSLASTLVGLGTRWSLDMWNHRIRRAIPAADIVINYPQGAFLVIRCNENIARELYFTSGACRHKVTSPYYGALSFFALLLLMTGAILMGNATHILQFNFAGAYMFLNAAYWIAATLPQRCHWDLSCYGVTRERYGVADQPMPEPSNPTQTNPDQHELASSLSEALWRAIILAGDVKWIRRANVAPESEWWNHWLSQARVELQLGNGKAKPPTEGMTIIPSLEWEMEWERAYTNSLNGNIFKRG